MNINSSHRTARLLALALFLGGTLILWVLGSFWPGLALVLGVPLALRNFLLGRPYHAGIELLVFGGLFISVQFQIAWDILFPVLFTVGGLYLFGKDLIELEEPNEEDIEEEIEKRD